MLDYLIDNKEWIFSGIGVAVLSWLLFGRSKKSSMSQKGGDNSTNIQVVGNITGSFRKDKNGDQ